MNKRKKNSLSTIDLYDNNLQRLMNISKFIDEDNDYPIETQNSSIFIKLLFQDIRKCSKWYENDEWRPIKTAIHNCYKLLQKGYVPENQGELENNIKILEKLLKDPSSKKSNVDKISEEVVQNIFDKTIKNLNINENNNNINNININKINEINNINISNKSYKEDEKEKNFFNNYNSGINTINNRNEFVTKEKMENALNEQKHYYEKKMNLMQNDIDNLKKKVNELNDLINNIGKCFIKSMNKDNK
jgi:hypothetical protein